jgi:UPF0755 protein
MEPNRPSRPVMDFLPPARQRPVITPPQPAPAATPAVAPAPSPGPSPSIDMPPLGELAPEKPKPSRKKWLIIMGGVLVALLMVVIGGVVGGNIWYQTQLQPVTNDKSVRVRVTIDSGSTPDQIGKLLQDKKIIRNALVFSLYTRDKGVRSQLQAGTFNLKPSDTMAAIVSHLVAGKTDEFSLTFLPGATASDARQLLLNAGYDAADINAAFNKSYDHPIFASKPSGSDLEGYIFGETYNFTGDATVEQILTRTFDQLESTIKQYDLVSAYQKQGLSLYQGITLASIIQREVASEADEKQVAQVFYKRLREGGTLGSDVTFIYAAKKLGVTPSPTLDSPYNTRVHPGLPPGPISNPGISALLAAANPASGDYSYFVAGDDGKTYFAHTYDEHQENVAKYCHKNCNL